MMNNAHSYLIPFVSLVTIGILIRNILGKGYFQGFDVFALIFVHLALFSTSIFCLWNSKANQNESDCPFGFKSSNVTSKSEESEPKNNRSTRAPKTTKQYENILKLFKVRAKKVIILYEDYVHLPSLRSIWECPVTASPRMEPFFVSGSHGIEIAFLLLAEFIKDPRPYITKRNRLDVVCRDLVTQFQLMSELLDGELEDTSLTSSQENNISTSSKPPTITSQKSMVVVSPGLEYLSKNISTSFQNGSPEDQRVLRNFVRSIISAFQGSFGMWSVGLGIEYQLNQLCAIVGLPGRVIEKETSLDYALMVRPQVVADTLFKEQYEHCEDFFFRSIHLGTDCWAFIVVSRLKMAKELATQKDWLQSAAQIRFAANVLNYLGDHVLLLVMMVLKDYLPLKVEIQGTSGEGSILVKSLRSLVLPLFDVLAAHLLGPNPDLADPVVSKSLKDSLYYVYYHPESFPHLYEFCKALEVIETAVMGGFFYKHFLLATNVVGSDSKGTMGRTVETLKPSYETTCFPFLDSIRFDLGVQISKDLTHNHAKIMNKISARHGLNLSPAPEPDLNLSPRSAASVIQKLQSVENKESNISVLDVERTITKSLSRTDPGNPLVAERARRAIYSESGVSSSFLDSKQSVVFKNSWPGLQFLDHSFGHVSPLALEAALTYFYGLTTGGGNYGWDLFFSDTMPEASSHIKSLLGLPQSDTTTTVSFGHNSHELFSKIISHFFDRLLSLEDSSSIIRIVTTDNEFYSWTRQMNRLMENKPNRFDIRVVPAMPLSTFQNRFVEEVRSAGSVDLVYCSQITFSQITLIPSIPEFVREVRGCLQAEGIVVIDAYHGFGAIPTSLEGVEAIYIAGTMKHMASAPNLAFAVIPPCHSSLRPVLTGWLSDISVLSSGSNGIQMGSSVGYDHGLTLMGSTPAFHFSMILFNHVMRLWNEHKINFSFVHSHVMSLHRQFLAGLKTLEEGKANPYFNTERLMKSDRNGGEVEDEAYRSHTLVFLQDSPADSAKAIDLLRSSHIGIDGRGCKVRVGFGLNHNPEDVEMLLAALR